MFGIKKYFAKMSNTHTLTRISKWNKVKLIFVLFIFNEIVVLHDVAIQMVQCKKFFSAWSISFTIMRERWGQKRRRNLCEGKLYTHPTKLPTTTTLACEEAAAVRWRAYVCSLINFKSNSQRNLIKKKNHFYTSFHVLFSSYFQKKTHNKNK